MRILRNRFADLGKTRNQRLAAGGEHQRVARVVDVFACAGKVNEFACLGEFRIMRDLAFDPVFHGLDVVVGGGFNRFDLRAVFNRKVLRQTAQEGFAVLADGLELFKARLGKGNEPFHFHAHAGVHEGRFREDVAQFIALTGITAVQGT